MFSLIKLLRLEAKENKVVFLYKLESILLIEDINEAVSVDEEVGDSNNIAGGDNKMDGSLKQFSLNSSIASLNTIQKPPVIKKSE